MEQSFFGKLKRVRVGDFLHIFLFLAALPISLIYRHKRPAMWLLCDTMDEARDNAYWLYRYLCEKQPQIDAVYAISKKSPDYTRVRDLGGEVIHYGSLRHWVYYLTARYNISSQKMGKPNAAVCYFLEVYGLLNNTRIFLQHGIITARLSFLYYEHTKMRLFVCSSRDEWQDVCAHYHYPAGYVQELGLCRFDHLHTPVKTKRQILVMPTWRMYIRNEIASLNKKERLKKFKKTDYFRYWNRLLHNETLMTYLREHEIKLIFYPHREMHPFLEAFQVDPALVEIASWPEYDVQNLLMDSALLITDFSSVAMDFAYLKKPLIYYHFDAEEFHSGHHEPGYFDFETDGFGPICTTTKEAVRETIRFAEHDFSNKRKYLERHSAYFDLWDDQNCARTFEAIQRIK